MWSRGVATGFAVTSLFLAIPAQADGLPSSYAAGVDIAASEKLRRLDIMLMVTGLRCRTTVDDFQADFQAFEARHLPELNAAARTMVQSYSGRMGPVEASRALDRISVQIANQYGNGHPWLGCHELKGLTQSLAQEDGGDVPLQAANEISDGDGSPPAISAPSPVDAPAAIAYAPTAEANGRVSLAGR